MSQRIHILVEGDTEDIFVRQTLSPHFEGLGIYLNPIIVLTKRNDIVKAERGGYVPFDRLVNQLKRLLGDSSATAVTTFFDFYGMTRCFPDHLLVNGISGYQRVTQLEAIMADEVGNHRFIPYLQLHEYETFLFVSPRNTAEVLNSPENELRIARVRQEFTSPEEINDDPTTAPSKRIAGIFTAYDKVFHGPRVALSVGLPTLRRECRHFDEWVTKLERLRDE